MHDRRGPKERFGFLWAKIDGKTENMALGLPLPGNLGDQDYRMEVVKPVSNWVLGSVIQIQF